MSPPAEQFSSRPGAASEVLSLLRHPPGAGRSEAEEKFVYLEGASNVGPLGGAPLEAGGGGGAQAWAGALDQDQRQCQRQGPGAGSLPRGTVHAV